MVTRAVACMLAIAVCLGAQTPPVAPAPKEGEAAPAKQPQGVFVLPMKGIVGLEITARLLRELVAEADKAGPGQIIVLEIDSHGGMLTEAYRFADVFKDARARHRVVAWVNKRAVSVAALLAFEAQDIYMFPESALGQTPPVGHAHPDVGALRQATEDTVKRATAAGHPAELITAIMNPTGCWYVRRTGADKAEFFTQEPMPKDALQLCPKGEPLMLTSQTALECGAIRGIAGTEVELARLLGLPEWKELSDRGRRIAEEWCAVVKNCEEFFQRLGKELVVFREDHGASSIRRQIEILEEIMNWYKRCRPCVELNGMDPEVVTRRLKELRARMEQNKTEAGR